MAFLLKELHVAHKYLYHLNVIVCMKIEKIKKMKTTKLGKTSLDIPALALGVMRMGTRTPEEGAAAINVAYEAGVNFIDSADIYGRGNSEKVFGKALKLSDVKREDLFIQSKTGIVVGPNGSHGSLVYGSRYEFTKEHILNAVDGILKRMDIDYLDCLVLHRPDVLMDLEVIKQAFDVLQATGKVRFFGVSNFNPAQFKMLQNAVSQPLMFDQVQFGLMHTGMIDFGLHTNMTDDDSINHDGSLLEFLRMNHITLQAWSPFQYGTFEGTFINNPAFPELNKKLQEIGDKYGVGKNAVAAAWILRWPGQVQVIMGTMTPAHIVDSAKGADIELTNQEWYDLYFAAGHDLP